MTKPILTQSRLKEVLFYDPNTGIFIWLKTGKIAGSIYKNRKRIKIDGISTNAARIAWLYMNGYMPKQMIDHINRNPLDDRYSNLREVSNSENQQNTNALGIYWNKRDMCWVARICANKNRICLGNYKTFNEARNSYLTAKSQYHILNIIE